MHFHGGVPLEIPPFFVLTSAMPESAPERLIPDCKVTVDGSPLDLAVEKKVTRVQVELSVDQFGLCYLSFNDADMKLMNGELFAPGKAIQVDVGFQGKLKTVFAGEVVGLEPRFTRDQPPSLRVKAMDKLHRLALATMTRAFNDVDDKQIVSKIAQEHGLSGTAPGGPTEHVMQSNQTDALFLRKIAAKGGNHLRLENKKLVIGPPPKLDDIAVGPGDALRSLKVRLRSAGQVGEVVVQGYDPKQKKEITGKAKAQGEKAQGAKDSASFGSNTLTVEGPSIVDPSDAERIAKGRIRLLSEGFVIAQGTLVGNPKVLPGATLAFDKLGELLDGQYRVETVRHVFSKQGYQTYFNAVRTAKKKAPSAATKAKMSDALKKASDEAKKAAEAAGSFDIEHAPKVIKSAQALSEKVQDAIKDLKKLKEDIFSITHAPLALEGAKSVAASARDGISQLKGIFGDLKSARDILKGKKK